MKVKSCLYIVGGGTVDVSQEPEDCARMLWGRAGGDDAHDMGYAALQIGDKPVYVNPQAVAYITHKSKSGTVHLGS